MHHSYVLTYVLYMQIITRHKPKGDITILPKDISRGEKHLNDLRVRQGVRFFLKSRNMKGNHGALGRP